MFENPRRGRQARNFTTNVPIILDPKSSSEQIFSANWRWVPLFICTDFNSMNLTLLSWRIQFVESGRHCHLHVMKETSRLQASDNAVAHATWYLSSFKPLVLANFLFCLRDINLTLGLLPLRGHVVWRDSVGVESSRIFFTRVLSGCYVILTSPKEGETAVYGIAVFCLQNLICLLFIFADQVFIDPTFFGIFVCGPLQSFVVNV